MNEALAGAGVGGQLTGAGKLEAFDDGRFAGAVGADDEGEGLEEGDDMLVFRIEAADAFDQQFVDRAHLGSGLIA